MRDDGVMDYPAVMTDADLLAAYQRTDGEPRNTEADALLAEIQARDLDI